MKKSYNPMSDVRSESVEVTKRLYRYVSDAIRALDNHRIRAMTVSDLFVPAVETERVKLRDYCERLMFFDPVGYGRRSEELLWRKGYYDFVSSAKRLRKGTMWKPSEIHLLRSHLQGGMGHYNHLLMRLQLDFKLDLRGITDFPIQLEDNGLTKVKASSLMNEKYGEAKAMEWAHMAVHRCLIYLGDLSRYLADLYPGYHVELPVHYYRQALNWKPEAGMPYNQLGNLSSPKNYSLNSVYYYMRCLHSSLTFEGAESNLASVLDRNTRWLETGAKGACNVLNLVVAKFLYIVDICYFNRVAQQGLQKVCEDILVKVYHCLSELDDQMMKPDSVDLSHNPQYITDDMLFKMTVMMFMCMQHLLEKGSDYVGIMLAFILALISLLLEKMLERIEFKLKPRKPPQLSELKHRRRRRRRRRHLGSSSSEDEEFVLSNSDLSEEELVFDKHSSDSDDNSSADSGLSDSLKYKMLILGDHPDLYNNRILLYVQKLCDQGFLLHTIKVCCDWLVSNDQLVCVCGKNSGLLVGRLASLFNHLVHVPLHMDNYREDPILPAMNKECDVIPLVEDVLVRGLSPLKLSHSILDWELLKTLSLTVKQEAYIRICKLVNVGQQLARQGGGMMKYSVKNKWFQSTCIEEPNEPKNVPAVLQEISSECSSPVNKTKLMYDMGQLWLQHEVRDLESKVKNMPHFPPYLVLDFDALVYYLAVVKQLVSSRKFIVVIPTVVISVLDDQKRYSHQVRDTIRWLEIEFQHGNRFVRAQRTNEHLTLPLIKYPKKKDKEAWVYFQEIECCYHISQNTKDSSKIKDNLVTLLTGSRFLLNPGHYNDFSPLGTANSAGINVEHIEAFHSKWKNSTKSHG